MKNSVELEIFWTLTSSQTNLTPRTLQFKSCQIGSSIFRKIGTCSIHGFTIAPLWREFSVFYCVKTYTRKKNTLSKKADPAFSSKGFSNWNNALVSFERHQNSKSHHHAVTVSAQEANPVDSQLSSAWAKQQDNARHCLKNIVSSVQYLARLGLALRGHETQDWNLFQLLKFKAKDDASLSSWLSRCHDYTSPPVQNEILHLLGNCEYCQKYCSLYPVSTSFAVLTHYRWHSRCLRSRARIYLF